MDECFHYPEGSPSNCIKILGLFGIVPVFHTLVTAWAQNEEGEEGCDTMVSVMDGSRCEEDGK